MADSTPSMTAYHRHLSNHVTKSLRATGSQPPAGPGRKPNMRYTTTSSTSVSKVSSFSTSENDPSTSSSPEHSAGTPPQDSAGAALKTTEAKVAPNDISEREREHTLAWKEAGSLIYSRLPPSFNLTLEKPARIRSGQPTQNSSSPPPRGGRSAIRAATMEKGMKGLGIDLAISDSQDTAIKMGLMIDPLVPRPLSPAPRTPRADPVEQRHLVPKASQESLAARSTNTNMSPHVASSSNECSRNPPAACRKSQESGTHARETDLRYPRGTAAAPPQITSAVAALRDTKDSEDDKVEEYELRREMRLKKRLGDLQARIIRWRDAIPTTGPVEFPEIEPTPPTPSIASGMLRLSPFMPRPTALPSGPSPQDIGRRFRALDALLGDMSLVQSLSMPFKRNLDEPTPLRPLSPMEDVPGLKSILGSVIPGERAVRIIEGMPTPKAEPKTGVMAYA